jgi:hypothetical protein
MYKISDIFPQTCFVSTGELQCVISIEFYSVSLGHIASFVMVKKI